MQSPIGRKYSLTKLSVNTHKYRTKGHGIFPDIVSGRPRVFKFPFLPKRSCQEIEGQTKERIPLDQDLMDMVASFKLCFEVWILLKPDYSLFL